MKLLEIAWPVYKLGNIKPQEEDGVVFVFKNEKDLEIVDDKNLPGDSLAVRRLKLIIDGVKLFKLKYSIFFLGDLIKLANNKIWFIDSKGKIFQYKKQHFAKLTIKKITKIIPSISCSLIEVEGIQARFKVLFPPRIEEKWAGLLYHNKVYIFYGFYTQRYSDTIRKV